MHMSQATEIFVIIVMCVILLMYVFGIQDVGEVEYKVSSIDGRRYLVQKKPDSQEAADYLADVNRDLVHLIQHLVAKHPGDETCLRLFRAFDPSAVSEGSPNSGFTSFSINKGEKVILCIRQKEDDSFVDKNVLLYVAVHELSHLATAELGHEPVFWNNFRFLLAEAISIGIYKKVDFDNDPEDYCGIQISSSVV